MQALDEQNVMGWGKYVNRMLNAKSREVRATDRADVSSCKEDCFRPQSLGGRTQELGRKARLQWENQNRARFFSTTAVGRIQYPDIDVTTY
jgi:hypothetical protein